MSTVTVQLFASYADLLGAPTVELPLTPGTTVKDLLYRIRSLPGASSLPTRSARRRQQKLRHVRPAHRADRRDRADSARGGRMKRSSIVTQRDRSGLAHQRGRLSAIRRDLCIHRHRARSERGTQRQRDRILRLQIDGGARSSSGFSTKPKSDSGFRLWSSNIGSGCSDSAT